MFRCNWKVSGCQYIVPRLILIIIFFRNGGHIKPPLHHDYTQLKNLHGSEQAAAIMRFRLQHIDELLLVAEEEECVKHSQGREVESLDVFYDAAKFEKAKEQLRQWKVDMPLEAEDCIALDKQQAIDVRLTLAGS